jgi:hypothetical protein
MSKKAPTRRMFIAAGGAGAVGMAALAAVGQASAAELGRTEKANIEVVEAFDKNMSDPAPNLDKLSRMKETCSEDIIWGTAGGMKLHGLPAVADWYTNFFQGPKKGAGGLRTIEYEYSETFAHGPVVVMYGLHFVTPPGGPKPAPTNFHCVVHVVKDGKIIERYDYSVR